MTSESQSKSGAVWPLALGAVAIAFGGFIPLPGVYYGAFQERLGHSVGWWEISIGPIGNTIGALVSAYALAAASRRTWAWRAALAFYLVCALIQGLGIAFWLEGMNSYGGGIGGEPDIVWFPGWGFRAVVMVAYAAGASILWFISKSIDATGRATGALFLLLVRVLVDQLSLFFSLGAGLARGETGWTEVLPWLAMPISVVVVAVVLYRRPATKWPVTLWRWKLASHVDVIALVAVSTLPGSIARIATVAGMQPVWFDLFDAVLALGIGISASLWWWKLSSYGGAQGKPTRAVGAVSAAAVALLAIALFAFARAGGIERLTTPLPLEGNESFVIILDAETEFEAEDAATMAALLETLGASVEIISMDTRSITLDVSDAIDRDSVLQALTPVRFLLSPVLDIGEEASPEVLRRGTLSRYETTRHLIGECASFEELAGTFSLSGGVLGLLRRGCRFAVQRDFERDECRLYCLSNEAVLASGDIQDAFVTIPEYDPRPVVSVVLSDAAAQHFENFTAEHIEENLAIEVDDELVSAPIIQARIGGGRLQITLGQSGDLNTMLQEAERLAAGLRPGGVQTPWRLRTDE